MERKFLEELGIEKEAMDKIMEVNGKDIEKAKKPGEAATERITELEAQLADVGEKLKAYDGVDVAEKDGTIAALQADIEAMKTESARKEADRNFMDLLNAEVGAAKGKNTKAVAALLDMEALKTSKNQKEDIAAAIKALAESDAYLFADTNPNPILDLPPSGGIDPLVDDDIQRRVNKYTNMKGNNYAY